MCVSVQLFVTCVLVSVQMFVNINASNTFFNHLLARTEGDKAAFVDAERSIVTSNESPRVKKSKRSKDKEKEKVTEKSGHKDKKSKVKRPKTEKSSKLTVDKDAVEYESNSSVAGQLTIRTKLESTAGGSSSSVANGVGEAGSGSGGSVCIPQKTMI